MDHHPFFPLFIPPSLLFSLLLKPILATQLPITTLLFPIFPLSHPFYPLIRFPQVFCQLLLAITLLNCLFPITMVPNFHHFLYYHMKQYISLPNILLFIIFSEKYVIMLFIIKIIMVKFKTL